MGNYLHFFWPFNTNYADMQASKIYGELRGICLAAVVWPIVAGTFLLYFGLSLTVHQQLLGLTMVVPAGVIALLIAGNILLQRDFRPIRLFLDAAPEQVNSRIASEALIQARNFQLLAARRVLLCQAPAFALGFSLMTLIANIFMGLELELWQLLIALMVAFMVGIGHAIFEFYAVAKLMLQVITLAHAQCGDLTPEQQQRIIRVDTKRKLLFVSGLIVMTPMIILGTTLLIRIRHELHQAALLEHLDMIMPGMIGWMLLIITVGSIMALRIFLRMASDTGDSLQELSTAMKKVEDGSLDVYLLERTSDEYAGIYRRFNRMVKELLERERLRDAFGRYVAKELADDVMQHGINLGSHEVQASVLFADIRDFTAMSEKMSAEEVVSLLNEYFSAVEPAIKAEGGWINKFGGDSLLAVFGVLTPQADHIEHAVQAALKMRGALRDFNAEQEKNDKHRLRIGVGIHCGEMVAGSVGSHERMEFTVIGDAVNMASRIEGLNKKWGTDILVSEDVARAIQHEVALETMPETRVHGISNPVQVFAVK